MTRRRVALVYLFLALIVGGHLYDIAAYAEHWPFSRYAMFASTEFRAPFFSTLSLCGVLAEGGEVRLHRPAHLHPFDAHKIRVAFENLRGLHPSATYNYQPPLPDRVRAALADVLGRYEDRRRAGRHDGPVLVGVRLYIVHRSRGHVLGSTDRPDERHLVAEVAR